MCLVRTRTAYVSWVDSGIGGHHGWWRRRRWRGCCEWASTAEPGEPDRWGSSGGGDQADWWATVQVGRGRGRLAGLARELGRDRATVDATIIHIEAVDADDDVSGVGSERSATTGSGPSDVAGQLDWDLLNTIESVDVW